MREKLVDDKVQAYALQLSSNYKEFKPGRWNYEDGCFLKGFFDLWQSGGNSELYGRVSNYVNKYVAADGSIKGYEIEEYNIDNVPMGRLLFPFYEITGEERFRKAISYTAGQLTTHPRISSGNFWHKKFYPHQVWLDGLYMGQPFYAMSLKLAQGEGADYGDIVKQFAFVQAKMINKETGLYYHGYDDSREQNWANKETGLSLNYWSRAMGWLAMALIDTLAVMGASKHAEPLAIMFKNLMAALLNYQDKASGMWYQVTDKALSKGNYLETSATLMFSYALIKGARLGLLNKTEEQAGFTAFYKTMERYFSEKDGVYSLGGICSVAGLGFPPGDYPHTDDRYRSGTEEYYYGEPIVSDDPKGAGICFMALSQIMLKY